MEESMAGEDPAALIRLLLHTLPEHFAWEELEDGLYDQLLGEGVPPDEIEGLRRDHLEFLAELEALQAACARGEEVEPALGQLAARVRRHEWLESAWALQCGLSAPAELQDLPPLPLPTSVRARAYEIGRRALAAAREQHGLLLRGLTVRVPPEIARPSFQWAVEDELAARGLEYVEVHTCSEPGNDPIAELHYEAHQG
jgi:hypothetical protein